MRQTITSVSGNVAELNSKYLFEINGHPEGAVLPEWKTNELMKCWAGADFELIRKPCVCGVEWACMPLLQQLMVMQSLHVQTLIGAHGIIL